MIKTKTCPYLGLEEDPNTKLDFPSQGNNCHRPHSSAIIEPQHQKDFCLSEAYVQCPIYSAYDEKKGLPAFLERNTGNKQLPTIPRSVMIGSIILAILFGIIIINNSAMLFNFPNGSGTNGYQSQSLFNGFLLPTIKNDLPRLQGDATRPTTTPVQCVYPSGWTEYLVQPTDSLFRLSVLYNLSVEDIQKANCLGKETVLLPGTTLFLPVLPTPTPTETPTPTFYATVAPPDPNSNPPPRIDPSSTPKPKINPPTLVPPTVTPPKPQSTTPVPKSDINKKPTKQPHIDKPKDPKPKPTKVDKKKDNKGNGNKDNPDKGKKKNKGKKP